MRVVKRFTCLGIASLFLVTASHAQDLSFYTSESDFLAAAGIPEVVDFEGLVADGEYIFSGNPGEYTNGVVTIRNDSIMFIMNYDTYGTGTFLSAQQSSPQRVDLVLPRNTVAAGFYYQSHEALSIRILGTNTIAVPAVPSGSLGFFGVTSSEPFRLLKLATSGSSIDLDDIAYVVDSDAGIELPVNDGDGKNNIPGGGDLDLEFDDDGILSFDDDPRFTDLYLGNMSAQSDGQIVLGGALIPEGGEHEVAVARINDKGELDPSFGNNGIVTMDVAEGADNVTDMELLPDGKIVLAGYAPSGSEGFIIRLNPDGTPDTTFGTNGITISGQFAGAEWSFDRIEVQPDGKPVLGAEFSFVYRYLANGTLDEEFGSNGRAARFGNWGILGLAIDEDGTIVSGGGDLNTQDQDFEIVRHNPDGTVDWGFGLDGEASIDVGPGNTSIIDLTIDSKGRIVAVALTNVTNPTWDTAVARWLPDGSPDLSFGVDGALVIDLPAHVFKGRKIEERPDGGLLISGSATTAGPNPELVVVSLHEDGTLDTGFAGQGWVAVDATADPLSIWVDLTIGSLALLPGERIAVLARYCNCIAIIQAPDWLPRFADVPFDHWAHAFVEKLAAAEVTAGCGNENYCPTAPVTRAQMAVFLERGMNGSGFNPPPASGSVFLDVAANDFAAEFIEQLYADGITSGCGNNNYCPDEIVSRDQMAVFLLRAKYGSGYSPPAPTGAFGDIPLNHWAAAWIEQLAAESITAGCGGGNYCPDAEVTRDQMAVFLVRAFGL